MTWNQTRIIKQVFSASNFGIDTAKFGTDFRKKCIIGFPNIYAMSAASPYFKYDLTASGVINGL